jgi:hypothetical protein
MEITYYANAPSNANESGRSVLARAAIGLPDGTLTNKGG